MRLDTIQKHFSKQANCVLKVSGLKTSWHISHIYLQVLKKKKFGVMRHGCDDTLSTFQPLWTICLLETPTAVTSQLVYCRFKLFLKPSFRRTNVCV